MNYEQARQRESDGRWDWTVRNDDRIWATGPCGEHTDGHATAEEAERHFYDWEVANLKPYTIAGALHPCEICQAWSDGGLGTPDGFGGPILCAAHRNADGYQQVRPFAPGLTLIHS